MNEKSLKLLEQYELELTGSRRGRGSYICETSLGKKLLADYHGSEKKIVFTNQLLSIMEERGYHYPDKVMANKEGTYICRDRDENCYILKDWYEGRECDTSNAMEIEQAVVNLAWLHQRMIWKEPERMYVAEDLAQVWQRHNRELKKINDFIRKRKHKTEFESLFLKEYTFFAGQAKEALQMLKESDYGSLRKECIEKGEMCHGNYNQHNIYFLGKRQIFTSDFGKCTFDIAVSDLYQFVRKIMEKQEWSIEMGNRMLEAYDRQRTLSDSELEYLKIRLCYPEKFWKLANQYINSRKSCICCKNGEKLEKLVAQEEKRRRFLNWI